SRIQRGAITMKICIVGCGAVGSLFAAHLARGGQHEIFAYDVWQDHIRAIQQSGLRLSGAADFTARLTATTNAAEIPRCDYGIVATKSTHTRSATKKLLLNTYATSFAGQRFPRGIPSLQVTSDMTSKATRGLVRSSPQKRP